MSLKTFLTDIANTVFGPSMLQNYHSAKNYQYPALKGLFLVLVFFYIIREV